MSGSEIALEEISFREIGDKAISVGEGSRVSGSSIDIEGSGVVV